MGRCVLLVFLAVGSVVAGGVEGYPEHLVERLPGQPKVPFRQYAGYMTVDAKADRNLFYYFVEAYSKADNRPLTLWLNGGPGCSSMGGAFMEHGPFYPSGDGRGLRINKNSWNQVSNLLYVDTPPGVGFSYSNNGSDYVSTTDEQTAHNVREFLLQWLKKFPEYQSRDLFLTGENYGHFIAHLAYALLNYNKQSTGFKFRIKGVALGNPLLDLDKDASATYEYMWSHGMISDEIGLTIMKECDFKNYDFDYENNNNLTKPCTAAILEAEAQAGSYTDRYDVLLDVCYPLIVQQELKLRKIVTKMSLGVDVCINSEAEVYLNLPEVQYALHANRTAYPLKWTFCPGTYYNITNTASSVVPVLKELLGNHIPLWIYSGDQDSGVPLLGTRTIVRELAADLKLYVTDRYRAWFHDHQIGGWTISYGDILTFSTVRGASQNVAYTQPSRALALFNAFISGSAPPENTLPKPNC